MMHIEDAGTIKLQAPSPSLPAIPVIPPFILSRIVEVYQRTVLRHNMASHQSKHHVIQIFYYVIMEKSVR